MPHMGGRLFSESIMLFHATYDGIPLKQVGPGGAMIYYPNEQPTPPSLSPSPSAPSFGRHYGSLHSVRP